MPAVPARRRLPVRGHDPRGRRRRDRPSRSASGSSRRTSGARTPSSPRCRRSSPGRCPTAPTSSRSRACRSRSAPPTTACSSSAICRPGETVLIQAGAGGVGIAAIQLAKRAGATVIATASSDERLERLERLRARPRRELLARRLGRQGPRDHRRTRRRPRRRLRRRADPRRQRAVPRVPRPLHHASAARAATRSRSTRACSSMGNQSLTGVFLGAEITTPRAQAMIGGLVDDVAAGPPARRGRPHVPARPRPPPRTPTSRAAKPSAASSSSPDHRVPA